MIIIKKNITFFSRNEVSELFDDDEYVNDFISEVSSSLNNAVVLNHKIITIDSYPTFEITLKESIEESSANLRIIKNWFIFYEDKIVLFQYISRVRKEFYILEPLFNSITNSVIFPEQYY